MSQKLLATTFVLVFCALSAKMANAAVRISIFNSVDANGSSKIVIPGKRLAKSKFESSGSQYRLNIEGHFEAPEKMEIPAIYIPYMGGISRVLLNGTKIFESSEIDRSIEGTVIPVQKILRAGDNVLEFSFRCEQTTFCGLWRGVPEVGEYQDLNKARDSEISQETLTPLVGAVLLLIVGATLLFLSFGLRKDKRTNQYLAMFLFSWGLFFLSYSGYFRTLSGPLAAVMHFPSRSITAMGLLLFIDSYFSSRTPKLWLKANLVLIGLGIVFQCYLGMIGDSLGTLNISAVLNLLAFLPLAFVRFRDLNFVRKLAAVLGYIAFLGQIRDSAMLFAGGVLFSSQTMYINKITLPPFVFFAFIDHLLNYIILTLKDRLLKTQSKVLSVFSIRAGNVFSKSDLEQLYGFFQKRLSSSEGKVFSLRLFHSSREKSDELEASSTRMHDSQQSVLRQIQNANANRIREYDLRAQTEKKIALLVKQLDPNLFEYIQNNLSTLNTSDADLAVERGIVFFDQKGYTTMLENLDEERAYHLAEIVNRWVSACTAKYAARIRNFNGDAYTLELYPLPNETREMLARRTCSLVWDLSQSVDELNHDLFKAKFDPVVFRFGAHVGRASGVKLDFISPGLSNIVGDNVNIAARLQTLARPGSVYVSGELVSLSEDGFAYRRIPRSYVKGRRRELEVFELIGRVLEESEKSSA